MIWSINRDGNIFAKFYIKYREQSNANANAIRLFTEDFSFAILGFNICSFKSWLTFFIFRIWHAFQSWQTSIFNRSFQLLFLTFRLLCCSALVSKGEMSPTLRFASLSFTVSIIILLMESHSKPELVISRKWRNLSEISHHWGNGN